jgi:hypothetical protein
MLNLEITMALRSDRQMFREWRENKGKMIVAETSEQREASAREAIPRVLSEKARKHYNPRPTLLVFTDDGRSLPAEELVRLTKPWNDCFPAVYLLCGMDAIMVSPKVRVLRGVEPF